jgi:hypothetical protein
MKEQGPGQGKTWLGPLFLKENDMAKFMLARGKKPGPQIGFKKVSRPGNLSDVVQKIEFIFWPGKAVDVPDDVDMSVSVEAGHIVPIRDLAKPKKDEAPKETKKEAPEEAPPASTRRVGESVSEPESSPEPEENGKGDYEEMEDGTFACLHCEKTYKSEKRIITHIEKEH